MPTSSNHALSHGANCQTWNLRRCCQVTSRMRQRTLPVRAVTFNPRSATTTDVAAAKTSHSARAPAVPTKSPSMPLLLCKFCAGAHCIYCIMLVFLVFYSYYCIYRSHICATVLMVVLEIAHTNLALVPKRLFGCVNMAIFRSEILCFIFNKYTVCHTSSTLVH